MIDLGINLFQEIAALGGGGGFNITNSLRFNDNDSAYLSRTPSVAGDRKTWTWSGWVKRGNLGTTQYIFYAHGSNSDSGNFQFRFETDNSIKVRFYTNTDVFTTSAVLRDVAGWYHLVLVVDTTQSTANDRIKIYVNGVQAAKGSGTAPTLNADLAVNDSVLHTLGSSAITVGSATLDGYMADVNFIDGQALTADDFGQIDATTGEWSPKKYSGTYGTNGFYLPFNGNANDDSGNGNNWTENNLASTDYMIDTPTNNFAVLNAVGGGISETLSEGNLSVTTPNAGNTTATIGVTSGKWYWEGRLKNDNYYSVGLTNEAGAASTVSMSASGSNSVGYWSGGGIYDESGLVATVASYGTADVVASALDMDSGNIKFYKNNSLIYTYTFGSSGAGTTFPVAFPAVNSGGFIGRATDTNFGADSSFAGNKTRQGNTDANGIGDFYYTPPTGYLALCTDNLPAPAIEQPETQFNVVTYTGNGGTQSITGVGFQPDFVWAKLRTTSSYHRLHDVVRGSDNTLASNVVDAEVAGNGIVSFDSDGFTMDSGTNINQPYPYVAWCWKAGGTAVSNTDGSITSQVSANVDAGFSIVGYTGDGGTGDATVGHGLTKAPELIIHKNRDSAANWPVTYTIVDGTNDYLYLNLTNSYGNATQPSPTSSVFYIQSSAGQRNNTENYIQYCFHSVEGFSKFGSYTGNGSADGPFIYTGFRPAFVLVKSSSLAGSYWHIMDAKRNEYNVADKLLYPNVADAEGTGLQKDFLSNGFKIRSTATWANGSGQTYIYMAFAEAPFKNAVAR